MHWPVIGFAIGIWLCQQQSALTEPLPFALGACVAFLVALLLRRRMRWLAWAGVLCACALSGFAYAGWRAEWRLADRLPAMLEGQNLLISGRVVDLPQPLEHGVRFLFDPDAAPAGVPQHLQLTWSVYEREKGPLLPNFHPGERWQLLVRLHRVHGNVNPNGFDFEGWMFERDIGAIGSVQPKSFRLLGRVERSLPASIDRWREVIRERFGRALPDSPWRGVLVALVVGDQGAIGKEQWTLFRRTGVTHLVSISGLHITLVGALLGFAVGWGWRRIPWLALRLPAQKAAVLAGVLAALLYVLLSGFSVPAQRTLYMLATAALALWLERTAGIKRVLACALLVVLLLDPWAVLSSGFWLSFGAVGSLLLVGSMEGRSTSGWIPRVGSWLRAQWAVTLFTLPMLLALFQQFSLVSPFANALAIPLVSMLVTPLALLFGILPLPSLAHLANWLLGLLMDYLQWCAGLPFAIWQQAAPPVWLALLCCLAALWALLPRGVPGRRAGLLLFVPLLLWQPERPVAGQAQVTVLDVGQGLAVHVRTATHDLLFDTGPRYSSQADAGERTVLPYLTAQGVARLDMLMVSHQDSDHAGGVRSILAGLPVLAYRASFPAGSGLVPLHVPFQDCLRGQHWDWDGVGFQVLYPVPEAVGLGNDGSCVLRIASRSGTLLLTGDIERDAEDAILADPVAPVHAEIVVAPHHGSRSSSQEPFVAAVHARYAVFTSGYLNRYHHPAPEVLARYVQYGAVPLRSDLDGAIRFDLNSAGVVVSRARHVQARYWFDISQ